MDKELIKRSRDDAATRSKTSEHPLLYVCMKTEGETRELAMMSTRSAHIKNYVKTGIMNQQFTYGESEQPDDQISDFEQDWSSGENRLTMNQKLHGCVLDTAIGGREYVSYDKR